MKKLLIATSNPGKYAEIKEYLSDLPIILIGLDDIRVNGRPDETGTTFEENAILKAKFYCKLTGLPTIGDDGGLEIDILHGEPGIKSHRWIHGEKDNSDTDLIQYTIQKLKGIPRVKRGTQLRAVDALVLPDGQTFTAEAVTRGIIAETPSIHYTKGYPYRSLLYLPEINKYYNEHELTAAENEAYNHRRKAILKLKPIIFKFLC